MLLPLSCFLASALFVAPSDKAAVCTSRCWREGNRTAPALNPRLSHSRWVCDFTVTEDSQKEPPTAVAVEPRPLGKE